MVQTAWVAVFDPEEPGSRAPMSSRASTGRPSHNKLKSIATASEWRTAVATPITKLTMSSRAPEIAGATSTRPRNAVTLGVARVDLLVYLEQAVVGDGSR